MNELPEKLTYLQTEIPIPQGYDEIYIPIKPICEIINTNYKNQDSWLRKDKFFAQLYTLRYTVGSDNKRRKMNCLPIIDVLNWVSSISNHSKTDEQIDAKYEFMIWFRGQLVKLFKGVGYIMQENERELHLLKKIEEDQALYEEKNNEAKHVRDRINHNLKALEEVRENRFKMQYEFKFEPRLDD